VGAWLAAPTLDARLLWVGAGLAVLPLPVMVGIEALACRAMGRVHPGVISRWSWGYLRVPLKAGLVDVGSRWLYGTLFWPAWLRLAGMKVGPGCEISSLIDTVPELAEIGERTFCADGIYFGGAHIHRGTVVLAGTRLGRNSFFGNGAIIPGGTRLPDDVLLGICTMADATRIRPGTAWFGEPPFELPRREVIQLDRRLTHEPSAVRYLVRGFWEVLRFALPAAFALVGLIWYAALAAAKAALALPVFLLVAGPLLNLAALAAPAGLVIAIKWTLLGRVRPGVHPLWSSWASRWDFVCLAWNIYAVELVELLDGTPGLAWLLRAAGVRVGRGVVLGTGFAEDLPDPDLLILEDGATVDCQFQAHTFEDRVLKMDYVRVRRHATVGRSAVLLYGADVGASTRVAPNSVVMKHEHLLPGLGYEGVPTRPSGEGGGG
jgi:non-ribosomal peptide synthetase-like protein